jgi:hypothetical protein
MLSLTLCDEVESLTGVSSVGPPPLPFIEGCWVIAANHLDIIVFSLAVFYELGMSLFLRPWTC